MGTPHMGSNKANWLATLSRFSNVLRTTNSQIVGVLEPGSQMLANLQQEFHTMLNDRARNHESMMEIFCYYEEVSVGVVGKVRYIDVKFSTVSNMACSDRAQPLSHLARLSESVYPRKSHGYDEVQWPERHWIHEREGLIVVVGQEYAGISASSVQDTKQEDPVFWPY